MNLKLPFGLHQMQWRPRWDQRAQTSPLKRTVILTERTLGGWMRGQACGHQDCVQPEQPGTPRM